MKDKILAQFLKSIAPVRPQIKRMILFGSRARNDQKPYSDYDILIVVRTRKRSLISKLYDGVVDVLLSSGRVISLKIFEEAEYQRLSSLPTPFMKNVLKEGQTIG